MPGLLLTASCVLALALGLALGHLARKQWGNLMPRWLPAALLAPGLFPIAWHFRRISDFISPVSTVTGRSGAASELETLSLALPFTVIAVWGLAILLTRRFPALVLAFPILATELYLTGLAEAAPLVREAVDARPAWLSLLVAMQLPVTIAVTGFLWTGIRRAGLFARWPLRNR